MTDTPAPRRKLGEVRAFPSGSGLTTEAVDHLVAESERIRLEREVEEATARARAAAVAVLVAGVELMVAVSDTRREGETRRAGGYEALRVLGVTDDEIHEAASTT
jgi:hypothetical protein